MIKNKFEFFVGIFILLGFISFLIILFQITNFYDTNLIKNEYKVNAIFKNIGNLKKKAKVTIGGVKIGYVSKIELRQNFDKEYYPYVEIKIDGKFNNIPKDSSANILMTNLLGESYIQIDLGNDEFFFNDGDTITMTTQALILEELISKFAFSK